MLKTLFGEMPREFGRKRVFVASWEEFTDKMRKYNGLIHCYATIYAIPKARQYSGAIIDKIYLDLDQEEKALESVQKAHKILEMHNIMHTILFTGTGYNLYIFAEPRLLQNPKQALRQAQNYIASICGLSIGKPDEADVDEHVIGDIARIARIPFTRNIKHDPARWCFPLVENMIWGTHQEIIDVAEYDKVPSCCILPDKEYIFGERKLDLSAYDSEPMVVDEMFEEVDITHLEKKYGKDEYTQFVKPIFPFIQELLYNTRCGYHDRYFTILCMKELGYPMELTTLICQHYWTPQKFKHCIGEEGQIQYLYRRKDLFFPKPQTVRDMGYKLSKRDIEMINKLYK